MQGSGGTGAGGLLHSWGLAHGFGKEPNLCKLGRALKSGAKVRVIWLAMFHYVLVETLATI